MLLRVLCLLGASCALFAQSGIIQGVVKDPTDAVVAGAKVIIADNGSSIAGDGSEPDVARETAKTLGSNAIAFGESVASPGVARQLVEIAVKQFGGIDIVVNNAAILRDAFVFRMDPRDWDAVIRNNLSAPFYLTSAAAAVMRDLAKGATALAVICARARSIAVTRVRPNSPALALA